MLAWPNIVDSDASACWQTILPTSRAKAKALEPDASTLLEAVKQRALK